MAAFQAGQVIDVLILIAIITGLARTFRRSDLTWREKIIGSRKRTDDE